MYILYISIQGHVKRFCIQDKKPFHFFLATTTTVLKHTETVFPKSGFFQKGLIRSGFVLRKGLTLH